MIPFLRTLAMFSLLPLTTLSAKLVFEDESLSYTATFDQEQTLAIFKFTNQGDQAVEILDMKASCGCTVPALSRRVYRPGESGEVRVTFKHSGRQGQTDNRIVVTTNEEEGRQYFLKLTVNIPRLMAVRPRLLFWRSSEQERLATKNFVVETLADQTIASIQVEQTNADFTMDTVETVPGRTFTISVAPPSMPGPHQSRVTVRVTFNNGLQKSLYTVLRVQ